MQYLGEIGKAAVNTTAESTSTAHAFVGSQGHLRRIDYTCVANGIAGATISVDTDASIEHGKSMQD
eukprot:4232357-Pyramimonas_sp.AAC.1